MGSKNLFPVVALALMVAYPAVAAEDWQRVAPADAKVSVGLGWTKATMGSLWVKWTPNYGTRLWVSSWQGGADPLKARSTSRCRSTAPKP